LTSVLPQNPGFSSFPFVILHLYLLCRLLPIQLLEISDVLSSTLSFFSSHSTFSLKRTFIFVWRFTNLPDSQSIAHTTNNLVDISTYMFQSHLKLNTCKNKLMNFLWLLPKENILKLDPLAENGNTIYFASQNPRRSSVTYFPHSSHQDITPTSLVLTTKYLLSPCSFLSLHDHQPNHSYSSVTTW
jgi:hypothetical protein